MPPRSRSLLAAVLTAAVALLAVPAVAAARTFSATVITPATADAKGRLTLPVLLSPRAEVVLKRPVIAPIVPAGVRPIRWGTGRLALAQLRPGDKVIIDLAGSRARRITLQRSGSADDFDRIARQLASLNAAVARTIALAQPVAAAAGGSYPRDQLRALRDQISDLQGELDAIQSDVQTSITRLEAVRPAQPHRHDAVAAAQAAYEQQLTAVSTAAKAARDRSDLAAEGLDAVTPVPGSDDGTQTPVDPGAPFTLPFGSTSTVSDLLDTLVVLSNEINLARPPLVG